MCTLAHCLLNHKTGVCVSYCNHTLRLKERRHSRRLKQWMDFFVSIQHQSSVHRITTQIIQINDEQRTEEEACKTFWAPGLNRNIFNGFLTPTIVLCVFFCLCLRTTDPTMLWGDPMTYCACYTIIWCTALQGYSNIHNSKYNILLFRPDERLQSFTRATRCTFLNINSI